MLIRCMPSTHPRVGVCRMRRSWSVAALGVSKDGARNLSAGHAWAPAYNTHLRKVFQEARIQWASDSLDVGGPIECTRATISIVLEAQTWSHAFAGHVWCADQVGVREQLVREL